RPTRIIAIVILAVFHGLNSQIFSIGYFPLIGIFLLLIFFEPGRFRRNRMTFSQESFSLSRPLITFASVFVAFQLLFPLRWHLVPENNPSWTDAGDSFAWRMMLRERLSSFQVYVDEPEAQEWLRRNPHQQLRMAPLTALQATSSPEFMRQYAVHLRRLLEENGFDDFAIYVHAAASLNGRPFQAYVDPNVDLSRVKPALLGIPDWIIPLREDVELDFDALLPEERLAELAHEAMRKYFEENPGPGSAFLSPSKN
ncbi:MAG: HTTM domain-containing protein, partial [Verrucomicrobiota bacterium]